MPHKRWWCKIIYRHGCPACKVRQMQYGFRMDPIGFEQEGENVLRGKLFTSEEKLWIAKQVGFYVPKKL